MTRTPEIQRRKVEGRDGGRQREAERKGRRKRTRMLYKVSQMPVGRSMVVRPYFLSHSSPTERFIMVLVGRRLDLALSTCVKHSFFTKIHPPFPQALFVRSFSGQIQRVQGGLSYGITLNADCISGSTHMICRIPERVSAHQMLRCIEELTISFELSVN